MEKILSNPIFYVGSIIFFLCLFIFIMGKKLKINRFYGIVTAVFVCGAFFLCFLSYDKGTLYFIPNEEPGVCADRFLNFVCQGKEAEAVAIQSSEETLFVSPQNPGEVEEIMISALRNSYSYSLNNPEPATETHAQVSATVNYLELSKIVPDINTYVNSKLADIVENSRKSEVYDENDNYRQDVLDAVYEEAVKKILTEPEKYYSSSDIVLDMDYSDGTWKVAPNQALKLALAGGSASGANTAANIKSEALGELTYIPKVYTIEENAVKGPKPNPENYGVTDNPQDIVKLVADNPKLTGDKKCFFNPDVSFVNKNIQYYADETILCYSWKEFCDGHACTFSEIYLSDPSQFRRKLSQDTYGSPIQKYASELSKETNAVVAMNGDFYKFRAEGVTVYQRELYRFNPRHLELCHVNSNGDLLFTYADELPDEESARKYIEENDVLFTLAFGPVLIANGEPHESSSSYLLGQVTERYSRSVLARGEPCHYLLMTINHGSNVPTTTVTQTRDIMMSKGVTDAYVLDGGQTAEIIMQNKVLNYVDFGSERAVSDILYFVTALPEEESQ